MLIIEQIDNYTKYETIFHSKTQTFSKMGILHNIKTLFFFRAIEHTWEPNFNMIPYELVHKTYKHFSPPNNKLMWWKTWHLFKSYSGGRLALFSFYGSINFGPSFPHRMFNIFYCQFFKFNKYLRKTPKSIINIFILFSLSS